jgi:hypothetical protein
MKSFYFFLLNQNKIPVNIGIVDIVINGIASLYVLKTIIVPIPANANRTPPSFGLNHAMIKQIVKIIVGIRWIIRPKKFSESNENKVMSAM